MSSASRRRPWRVIEQPLDGGRAPRRTSRRPPRGGRGSRVDLELRRPRRMVARGPEILWPTTGVPSWMRSWQIVSARRSVKSTAVGSVECLETRGRRPQGDGRRNQRRAISTVSWRRHEPTPRLPTPARSLAQPGQCRRGCGDIQRARRHRPAPVDRAVRRASGRPHCGGPGPPPP